MVASVQYIIGQAKDAINSGNIELAQTMINEAKRQSKNSKEVSNEISGLQSQLANLVQELSVQKTADNRSKRSTRHTSGQ